MYCKIRDLLKMNTQKNGVKNITVSFFYVEKRIEARNFISNIIDDCRNKLFILFMVHRT